MSPSISRRVLRRVRRSRKFPRPMSQTMTRPVRLSLRTRVERAAVLMRRSTLTSFRRKALALDRKIG
jgi:hypothetical protein